MVMAASVGTFQPGLGLLGLLARGYRGDPFVPGAGFAMGDAREIEGCFAVEFALFSSSVSIAIA